VSDSLAKIELRPWLFLKELILYVFFGLGLLLSPVLELSVFIQSRLLDEKFRVSSYSQYDLDSSISKNRPDIEIMPVGVFCLVDLAHTHAKKFLLDSVGRCRKAPQGWLLFFHGHASSDIDGDYPP
jgi:hypothetical protein